MKKTKMRNPADRTGAQRFVYEVYISDAYRICAVMGDLSSTETIIRHLCASFSKGTIAKELHDSFVDGLVKTKLVWAGKSL